MSISPHKVLIVDAAYQPHHWASAEDAIVLVWKNLISHSTGSESIFRGGTNRRTFKRTEIEVNEILFLKEALRYDSRIPPLTNQNLFARDGFSCMYCGRHYAEHKLSRDHIIPVSRGGKNIWENVATACKTCNHEKDDNLLEDTDMKLLAVPYVPNHAERLIMSNRRILASQMEFLTQYLPKHSRINYVKELLN